MTAISWKSAVDGSWTTGADWSTGAVPLSTDAVTIGVAGFYTVSLTGSAQSVHSLNLSDPDATLAIAAPGDTESVAGNLINGGTLTVDVAGAGGTTVAVGGTLTNSGDLDIGNSLLTSATTMTAGGLGNTASGTLNLVGSSTQAALKINAAASATWTGFGFLTGDALLQFASGGITGIAANSELSLDGAQARVARAETPGSNSALTGLAGNAGTLDLENGATVRTSVRFANKGTLTVDGGSRLVVGGVLNNTGFLDINDSSLSQATIVTASGFANTGTLFVSGGSERATLNITGAAPTTVTGSWQIDGDAVVRFGSGGVTQIAKGADLSIDGPRARLSLSKLASNAGTFSLADGATASTTGGFSNSGTTEIDSGGSGGSSFTIGGTLTNSGSLIIGNVFNLSGGTTGISAATTVTAAGLVNTGQIQLSGGTAQAKLAVAAAAPATLTGSFSLKGDALLQYGSGAITAIGNLGSLSLDGALAHVALSAAPGSNSALTTLGSTAGTFSLADGAVLTTTAGFNNSGFLSVDPFNFNVTSGGSSLTIGGTLTNSGSLYIGNTSLTAATKVTAAALINNSYTSVYVFGNTGGSKATLTLTGASSDANVMDIGGGGVLALGNTLTVTGSLNLSGGTISGGTLAGAGSISVGSVFGGVTGTLNGVTVATGATVAVSGGTLVVSGVTVDGAISGGNGFSGSSTLNFAQTGTDAMTNISGFQTINLANGAANTLGLTSANFTNVGGNTITVNDGNSGNSVTASTLSSTDAIIVHAGTGTDKLTGGAGNDIFYAGGKTTMTGGAGANQFTFASIGTNTIADFAVAGSTDELVFSNSGFKLGLGGATSTPQALSSTLIGSLTTGSFSNTVQRFAYKQSTGQLLFGADGNGGGSQLVATLTGDPTLTASHLFFVS